MTKKTEKKKILCIGSAGFILSNFIRYAVFNGYAKSTYNIASIDKGERFNALYNIYGNKNHQFRLADITDEHILNIIFEEQHPDIIINAVNYSGNNSSKLIKNKLIGTQNLLNAAVKWNCERFVQLSSASVYGRLIGGLRPTEVDITGFQDEYGAVEGCAENLVRAANTVHKIPVQIIRCCNIFGPRENPNNFIPKTIQNILNNEPIVLENKGQNTFDWLFVEDFCSALIKVLEKTDENSTSYNITAELELTELEMAQKICNILNKGWDLISVRDGENPTKHLMRSVKLEHLDWKTQNKLTESLATTISWYINNKNWVFNVSKK